MRFEQDARTLRRHRAFLQSPHFAPELERIPLKWRSRVVSQTLARMAPWSWYRIYEPVAVEFVRDFTARYVPAAVDITQDDADICANADRAAANVVKMLWTATSDEHALALVAQECADYGIAPPAFEDDLSAVIARAIDARWWRRQLRKVVKRAFEGGNIRLGYVAYRGEPYASNEAVLSRLAQNRRNAAALEATLMENEAGQQFSIAELAERTTANKAIRRGELMVRINGFDQIARDCGDTGLFLTWTCPSRFHATRHDGRANPRFDGSTPREANRYLCKMTALARSALARRGIGLYGFRIAEPHHDGCPHWHMLVFVRATEDYASPWVKDVATRVERIMKRYAWRVDRGEPGAFQRRLRTERIDWSRGSAASYIAKYVAKNLDGVADHKTQEGYLVVTDQLGDVELQPSARVEAWAATWGIRQFQQWGGAPVTVWRELRRVPKEMVREAPPAMAQAWQAVQKIEGEKRACWASYLRAQGGALVARKALQIRLAKDEKLVAGRYGQVLRALPYGVRCRQMDGVVFKSVRHVWTPVLGTGGRAAAGVGVPWTRVNNCTQPAGPDFAASRPAVPPSPAASVPDMFSPLLASGIYLHPANVRAGPERTRLMEAWEAIGACPWPRADDPRRARLTPGQAVRQLMHPDDMPPGAQRDWLVQAWHAIRASPWPRHGPPARNARAARTSTHSSKGNAT